MSEPTKKQITLLSKTCQDCWHKHNNDDGGFCYIFEEKPPTILNHCGQFKEIKEQKS